ncbi:MAG: hypothetical protein Q8Q73_13225 [Stagnimonas sp.]|nr:hypothetical protein [Stagnimonas sp.]
MKTKTRIAYIALLITTGATLQGCKTDPIVVPTSLPGRQSTGFQCLPVPSDVIGAGNIFMVDSSGTPYSISLRPLPNLEIAEDRNGAYPSYSSHYSVNAGLFLSTLDDLTANTGLAASVTAERNRQIDTSVKYDDTKLDVVGGQPEPIAIAWFRSKGYTAQAGERYFFVREALRASKVEYEISKSSLTSLGGEANFRQLAAGKLTVAARDNSETVALNVTLSSPVNVCIKARELVIGPASDGVSALGFKNADPIAIKHETVINVQ